MRIKFVSAFAAAVIVFLTSITILGQKGAVCKIGTTTFDCPAGFLKLPDVDATTRLFQSKDKDNPLKLFVTVSADDFVDSVLRQTHERSYSIPAGERFEWKTVTNPLTMDVETKYKHRVIASLGFWNKHLLELKSFIFSVKGKNIVIGYSHDWGEQPQANARLFEKGEGIGDTAVGCNAVVTLLNSITKEFKEKRRYCSMSTFTSQ